MKTAYLVLGAESSGTRLLAQILVAAGCSGGAGHQQRWDTELPIDEERVVWRRSIPHDHRWPNIGAMVNLLEECGYEVRAVVTMRDWYSAAQSQVRIGHVDTREKALEHLQRAYKHIFEALSGMDVPYVITSYETLVQYPAEATWWLGKQLGLEILPVEIYDGNVKYYR